MVDRKDRVPTRGDPSIRGAGPAGRERAMHETPSDKSAFGFNGRRGDESIPELLGRLVDQGTHLAEKQAELVKAEVTSAVGDVKRAAGAMAGAAVLGIAGLGVLLMGLSFLLGEVMELWLATLIVAAVTLIGAYALYASGQEKLRSSSMSAERSRRTLERTPDAITGHEDRTND